MKPLQQCEEPDRTAWCRLRMWFAFPVETGDDWFRFDRPTLFLRVVSETHRVGQMDDSTWLLGNINQTGYFRVNYDLQNWKLLIQQLHTSPQVRPVFYSFSPVELLFLVFTLDSSCSRLSLSDHLGWKQGGAYRWRLQPGQVSLRFFFFFCWRF